MVGDSSAGEEACGLRGLRDGDWPSVPLYAATWGLQVVIILHKKKS